MALEGVDLSVEELEQRRVAALGLGMRSIWSCWGSSVLWSRLDCEIMGGREVVVVEIAMDLGGSSRWPIWAILGVDL